MERKEFLITATGILIFGKVSALVAQDPPSEKENLKKFTVIAKRCDGCGRCFRACRDKALLVTETGKAFIITEKCKGCGDCVRFCRRMAIIEVKQSE